MGGIVKYRVAGNPLAALMGEANVTYFDDKQSGHPVRFIIGDQQVLVTSYQEVIGCWVQPPQMIWVY